MIGNKISWRLEDDSENIISLDPVSPTAVSLAILKTETHKLRLLLQNRLKSDFSAYILLVLSGNETSIEAARLRDAAKAKSYASRLPLIQISFENDNEISASLVLLHRCLLRLKCAYCNNNLLASYLNLFTSVHNSDGNFVAKPQPVYFYNSLFPAKEAIAAIMLDAFFSALQKKQKSSLRRKILKLRVFNFFHRKIFLRSIWYSERGWLERAIATCSDIYLGKTLAAFFNLKILPFLPHPEILPRNWKEAECFNLSGKGKYADACKIGLGIADRLSPEALCNLADNFFQLYNFQCAALCAAIGAGFHPDWKNGLFLFLTGRYLLLAGETDEALAKFCKYVANSRNGLINLDRHRISERLNRSICKLDWNQTFAIFRLRRGALTDLPKARLLCLAGKNNEAEKLLEGKKDNYSQKLLIDIYLKNESFAKAESLIKMLANSEQQAEKSLELAMRKRNRKDVIKILQYINELHIPLRNHSLHVLANFYADDMQAAFQLLGKPERMNILSKYFPEKIISAPLNNGEKTAIIADCFIGDETRYARIYPVLAKVFDPCIIICNEKLYPLLKRTFPGIEFFPSRKLREAEFCDDFSCFSRLPGLECSFFLDNMAFDLLHEIPHIIPLIHALPFAGGNKKAWLNLPVFRASEDRVNFYKDYLCEVAARKNLRHIAGLSWRSSISDRLRDLNRFKETLLQNLLSFKDILFVNCQYDGMSREEQEFFGQHENFLELPNIDQFNDMEETAALYSALDLMISSNTFSGDLAASLGNPVIMPLKDALTLAFCGSAFPQHMQENSMRMFHYRNDSDFPELELEIRKNLKTSKN